jgi:beta-phosphoglucomutase-like phosphatase (HAD superfamily)
MAIDGLRIFISHAAEEDALADNVAQMFASVSLGAIESWRSTGSAGIAAGDTPWVRIHEELGSASRILVLLTPFSCNRAWLTYESGFMAGYLAAAEGRSVIPLLCGITRSQVPDPLAQYQCYSGDNEKQLAEMLGSCLRSAGLTPNADLVLRAAERFAAEMGALLGEVPSISDASSGAEIDDRLSFPSVLAERLADQDVKTIRLVTYTAEVDAGLIDRFHVRGEKTIEIYKRSILADLGEQQSTNLQRLAAGTDVRLWDKRAQSVDASYRLERNTPPGSTVQQFLYRDAPTKRAYIFDDREALVAYYETLDDPLHQDGSVFKGVTDAPALHVSSGSPLGQFQLDELQSLLAGLRRTSRPWTMERDILEGAPWIGPGRAPCLDLRAVLLDLDGVLYDSLPQYQEAWGAAFEAHGYAIPFDAVYEHEGRPSSQAIGMILQALTGEAPADRLVGDIRSDIHDRLSSLGKPRVMDGAADLVASVQRSKLDAWVVTGSSRKQLRSWIDDDFPGLLTPEQLIDGSGEFPGKPSPVPYLLALEKAGIRCCDAVVIENGPLGIESAAQANVTCLAVNTGPLTDERLRAAGAQVVFASCGRLAELWPQVVGVLQA